MPDEEKELVKSTPKADSVEETDRVSDATEEAAFVDLDTSDEITEEEEELEIEQEEGEQASSAGAKYDVTTEAISGAQVVDDHAYVNINYYIQTIKEIRQGDNETTSRKTAGGTFSNQEALQQKYVDNLKQERESTFFLPTTEATQGLPENEESISDWYYQLDEYEQCYVQATAILHGAPAHEVSVKADSLYRRMREQAEQQEVVLQPLAQGATSQGMSQRCTSSYFDPSQQRKPGRELRERTHTLAQRVDGIERLFWQDVDTYGISNFGLRFLEFLAREFTSRGEHGQNFLKVIEEWATKVNYDYSQQAAHAYGVILWCQNVKQLRETAKSWAKEGGLAKQRQAAALLDGAYEIDLILDKKRAENIKTSPVLQQLSEWTVSIIKPKGRDEQLSISQTKIGCTAANTYGQIGKRSPEKALAGLEILLRLLDSQSTDNTNTIFAAGVSAYVTLIWSGHIRLVLKQLATNAELFSHQYKQPDKLSERTEYRRKREVYLNATFEAFFLTAGASISGIQEIGITFYGLNNPLLSQPQVPDPYGRDVLLAGLLLPNETKWRDQLMSLLCAVVIERKSGSAFTLMRQWADTVLKIKYSQDSNATQRYKLARQMLVNFMVDLGKRIEEWMRYRSKRRQASPQAFDAYKYKLEQWLKEGKSHRRPIGVLACDVLKQLN